MPPRTRDTDAMRDVARRITSVDDFSPYAKVLVFGPNGAGKTRFAASAPRVLIVDVNEEGTRSAVGSGARKIEVHTWDEVADVYWLLKSGKTKFESVALDGITSLQNLAMSKVLGEAEVRDPRREKTSPDKRSYGRCAELMKGMLYAYRGLPMHVIFTALPRVIQDPETDEVTDITVDLPAGSRGTAMGCVSVMGYMERTQVKVRRDGRLRRAWADRLTVGPHEVITTKDRTNLLGDTMINPKMSDVIKAWLDATPEEEED